MTVLVSVKINDLSGHGGGQRQLFCERYGLPAC